MIDEMLIIIRNNSQKSAQLTPADANFEEQSHLVMPVRL